MKLFTFLSTFLLCLATTAQTTINEENIKLSTDNGELYGSLTMADANKSTVALIIAGSGPTDRNCNAGFSLYSNAYKLLAEQLAMNGISTLRYDKRGVGESAPAKIAEDDMRFDRFIDDAVQWIELLKGDKGYKKVYIIGHSQGSLIGMMAAQQTKADGFISISGAGRPIDQVLQNQLKPKLPEKVYEEAVMLFDTLRMGQTTQAVNPYLYSIFRPSLQVYMISWMQYDPADEIAKLDIPMLLINGTTDIQVSVDNAQLLHEAAPKAQLQLIEGMNHVLKDAPLELKANMATYSNGTLPVNTKLVEYLVEFMKL
ncbi:alpha/beta fold hydrolase [Carboxylicivirga mesophila]|uniref:Alpha/beta fold hydrolase n=1 Tax=Carboxylicivirga mesophila TaxID=1166478 RepID=A0ABS5KG49_9BACT|nr:alpha/beta fold hydrolase [Carboxylicivirga mesophila]MBS2213986.1 alpha/beta fold hydrolase [Carboxylicivirga mesophila]